MSDISLRFSGFEWDRGNVEKSLRKHGVTPAEAEETFFNGHFVVPDTMHSTVEEARYVLLGETDAGRALFIALTIRASRVRIISARPMSRKERRWYEEEKKNVGLG